MGRQRTRSDLVNSDVSDLAVELRLFGNDCLVYYGPEDARLRDAVDNLGDVLGVDLVGADDLNISDDDISDDDVGEIKDVLVEMVSVALIEWNGHDWADLPVGERERVLSSIRTPRPDGWGLAGLMDAWTDIQVAVEENRNERLERVRKFRNPERRLTGYKNYRELMTDTRPEDREFLFHAVAQWHDTRGDGLGGL